MSLSLIRS